MNSIFIICAMLFMHVLDDYGLQSRCLAFLKQRDYWQKEAPEEKYKYDYIVALFMHGLSWAFMIMLPIAFALNFNIGFGFIFMFALNTLMHAWIDDMKANKKVINLWVDQACHMVQIASTFIIFARGGFVC